MKRQTKSRARRGGDPNQPDLRPSGTFGSRYGRHGEICVGRGFRNANRCILVVATPIAILRIAGAPSPPIDRLPGRDTSGSSVSA